MWATCDYSTYFHSPEWAEIWEAYSGGRITPTSLHITFSDRLTAIVVLSASAWPGGLAIRYSSPAGTYGGWISGDPLTSGHAACLSDFLYRHTGNLVWRVNPINPLRRTGKLPLAKQEHTHIIDLREGFEPIARQWKKGNGSIARKINKARKSGVTARKASSAEDWAFYYKIYQSSLERWGKTASISYGWPLFETMMKLGSEYIDLWVAEYQGAIICGALCFSSPRHVSYWHGAALESHFSLRPVNLLIHEIIEDAASKQKDWFDFNPSGGIKGVEKFKESFGSERIACPVVDTRSFAVKFLQKARSAIR